LSLEDKTSYEKTHTRYCKTILGLKKMSFNISAKSELGRFPITSFIKTQVLMYFIRINSNNINPLIKESLNVNKKMHNEGKYSWYTCVNNIFKEFDLDIEDYSNIDKPFHTLKFPLKKELKKIALNNYTLKTKYILSKLTESSKLLLYSKLKNDIILEPYLLQLSNFKK
jgi:hypothetical protein